MIIKIIWVALAILFAVASLAAKKLLPLVLRREVSEQEIVLTKAVGLLICIALAMLLILPDYL